MEAVMTESEACCSRQPATDKSKKNANDQKLLQKAVKKAYKAQKLLNEALKRLEASSEKQKKKHKPSKYAESSSSSTSFGTSASSSSSSTSSSSSSDTDGETFIDLTNDLGKTSKRHHGRKHHHGRRNRRGRDRSRSRSHSRGRSRGRSRGYSRGHSRGRSRGHSRDHSKTRDQHLHQLSQFFRGASLQTAPPILHGHPQQHHRHTRSHTRPQIVGIASRRSRSNSHDRHNNGGHKKKRKNKKHHNAKEQSKPGASGSENNPITQKTCSNCRYYLCSHARDRPRLTSGRPYNGGFSDMPALMQHRGDTERLQSLGCCTLMPVYYDEARTYRRRAHSEPRH